MTSRLLVWALALAGLAPCRASEAARVLNVSNDGLASFSAASGATTWTGTMTMDHPRFRLAAKGAASLFGGPALRRTSGRQASMQTATFKAETEWISLVVLGDITITVREVSGDSAAITAHRVVFVPAEDRLLIDGKPWPFKASLRPASH